MHKLLGTFCSFLSLLVGNTYATGSVTQGTKTYTLILPRSLSERELNILTDNAREGVSKRETDKANKMRGFLIIVLSIIYLDENKCSDCKYTNTMIQVRDGSYVLSFLSSVSVLTQRLTDS